MAETSKKTTVKYKFGQRELDMQDYINNIDYNVQSYVNDRKQNRGWTNDQVAEFQASYNRLINAFKQQLTDNNNRFSADAFGTITDSQGEFNNVDNDYEGGQYYYNDKGERIDTNAYNSLKDKKKKKYKTFDANRQVAEYFRIIGNKLQNAPKPETTKFDLNKHGFAAWWNKVNNPMGGEPYLQPYLDQDPVDANGKRKVDKRAKIAADWMDEYLKWLGTQDLDYSNYDQFKDYDTYANQGKALAAKWRDNKWESDDIIKANAFGVDPKFSKGFFTTEENADLTPEQREQIAAEKKAAEEQKKLEEEQKREEQLKLARNQWVDNAASIFNNKYSNWYSQEKPNHMYFDRSQWYTDDGKLRADKLFQSWGTYYLNQNKTGLDSVKLNQYMDSFLKAPFRDYKNDERVRNILSLIYAGIAEPIIEGKLQGMYYIPRQNDTQDYGALIYNPNKQQLFYSFIADVPSVWNNLKTQYLKQYENLNTNAEHYFKEGGIISLQYGGDFGGAFANKRNDYIKSKADAANTDVKTYTARSREPAGSKNALKPNNGFTSNDILRLTAIGTDLASMIASFTPAVGASTAIGAAGTTQHLIADIREDGLDWGDIGNAALGYSMDVLGLIPGTAAVTKSAKIIKTLKTLTPRIIAAIGTVGTIANAPEMIKSLNKLNTDEHLTVQDWQNITNAVTLVVQGVAAGGRKYHTIKGTARGLVKPAQTTDNVAIRVRKKGTKNVENIILSKAETKQAKAAKNNKELSQILQSRKDMEGYELATNKSLIPRLRIPRNGNSMIYFKQQQARLMPIMRDQKTGRLFARNGRWGADVIGNKILPNEDRLARRTSKYRETLEQDRLDDIEIGYDPRIQDAKYASDDYKDKLQNKDSYINYWQTRLNNEKAARDAYVTAHPQVTSVKELRTRVQNMADELAGVKGASIKGGLKPNLTGYNAKQTAANDALYNTSYRRANRELTRLRKELKDLNEQLNRAVGRHKTPIREKIAAKQQEIDNKTQARTKLKTDHFEAIDWLKRNNTTEYGNLRRQLAEARRQEKGLQSYETRVTNATNELNKIKGMVDKQGQTPEFQKLRDDVDPTTNTINFTLTDPTGATRTVKRNWDYILKKYGIQYKEGGKFNNVRKYNLGSTITNVTSNADWFTDMYSHQSMQDWLNKIDKTNYETFNNFQTSWKQNLVKSGYTPGKEARGGVNGPDPEIKKRQENWNITGTNAAIEQAILSGKIKPSGNSGDNKDRGYVDGYFGAQEYLRHGGTGDSWKGHDTELQALINAFKSKNLDYYLDPETNMYLLKPLESTDKKGTTPVDSKKSSKLFALGDEEKKQSTNFNQVRQFNIDPRVYSVAHNVYANTVNDRMTANQIDAMRRGLTLYDPKNTNKYLRGKLDKLMDSYQIAGQIYHVASQPLTSDGNLQSSVYTDAIMKALDFVRQGNNEYNESLRESGDTIWNLRYDESNANYDNAMRNKASIGNLIDNIANAENANNAKKFANNHVLYEEFMAPIKQKANKREALEERFALSGIKTDIRYNLSDYAKQIGMPLSKDEEEAWQAIISGSTTYSGLGGNDNIAKARLQKAYISASRKAEEIEQNKIGEYYGIAPGKYAVSRQMAAKNTLDEFADFKLAPKETQKAEKGGTLTLKDGSKIAVAKIRERSKDADRFYKTVKDIHDRVDKAIARIDKKMYRRRDPEKRRK